jgi:hypothetical protein
MPIKSGITLLIITLPRFGVRVSGRPRSPFDPLFNGCLFFFPLTPKLQRPDVPLQHRTEAAGGGGG